MSNGLVLKSPIDGKIIIERSHSNDLEINKALDLAVESQKNWSDVSLTNRASLLTKFISTFCDRKDELARELTLQMGRPISYTPGEINGTKERAEAMIKMAEEALGPVKLSEKSGFDRYIKRDPLGVVFTVAAWNYPYLIAVNSVIPALMAGNSVVLKHSAQTPLCAERFAEAFKEAGLPEGLFQYLHLNHSNTAKIIKDNRVNFVAFTGSVGGGHAIQEAASGRFIGTGLELGGKDPAYVCQDANFKNTVESLVDGAFFNSGQSCCGIERIYVEENVYEQFVESFVDITKKYKLGNPLETEITLGPLAKLSGANYVREQIKMAQADGAKALIDAKLFPEDNGEGNYVAPQVLINVNHQMSVMKDESFGPVVGIMKVKDDQEAINLMNDSEFGLTASIWTSDYEKAVQIGNRVETGTWFMNRCDYLDPELAWTGIKDTGKGCTLSKVGYEQLTRPKSFHLRNDWN